MKRPALCVLALLGAATPLLSRKASGADPTTAECLTAYEDSINLRRNQRLRATLAKLVICSSDACPAEIRAECTGRVREIDASMPTVVFEAKDPAGMNLVAVTVKIDGEVLAERLQGKALSIDPGEHTFTFEAAGRASVEKRLLILEGEKLRRERVELEALAAPAAVVPPPAAVAQPDVLVQPAPAAASTPGSGNARAVGLVVAGVGVASFGLGAAYGLVAMSRRDEANKTCPNLCSNPIDVDLWNSARSAGNISTAAFVIGGVAVASGVVVWWRARPSADAASGPRISLGPGGLQVAGRW